MFLNWQCFPNIHFTQGAVNKTNKQKTGFPNDWSSAKNSMNLVLIKNH